MKTSTLVGLLAAFALGDAAARSRPAALTPQSKEPAVTEPSMQWKPSLAPGGGKLRIDYTVTNPTSARIYVCEKIVEPKPGGKFATTHAVIVKNGAAGVVRLVLGRISPDEPVTSLTSPAYRPVEPGSSVQGSVEVALPLRGWHPNAAVAEVPRAVKLVSFELQMFKGEPPRWVTLPAADGGSIKAPDGHTVLTLKSEPQAIPQT